MPVMQLTERSGSGALVGDTEFVAPDNEAEQVKLHIFLASPSFVDEALQVSLKLLHQTVYAGYVCG